MGCCTIFVRGFHFGLPDKNASGRPLATLAWRSSFFDGGGTYQTGEIFGIKPG
jgi:hypothetical protein